MAVKIGKVSKTRLGTLNKLARSVIRQRTPFDKHLRIRAQEVLELVAELQEYRKLKEDGLRSDNPESIQHE